MLAFVGKTLEIPALKNIAVPKTPRWRDPEGTGGAWKPVNHGELAEALLAESSRMGLRVKDAVWGVNETESDLFGALDFEPLPGVPAAPGVGPALALRHSNQGRYALTLAFGGRVFVCENGLLIGETTVRHKHTISLDLQDALRRALLRFVEEEGGLALWTDDLMAVPLDERQAGHLLLEGARRGVVPWTMVKDVDEQWREPKHEEFSPRTAWSLYNAFTEACKGRGLTGQLETLRGLRGLFTGAILERRRTERERRERVGAAVVQTIDF
jgi:hypothetical protein